MITRHILKSCCGGKSYILQTEKPVKKSHISTFEKSGYLVPSHYNKAGLFFVQKNGLIATAPFGSTKIQIRASGRIGVNLITEFETLLDELTSAK